jgi:hypothetical protein
MKQRSFFSGFNAAKEPTLVRMMPLPAQRATLVPYGIRFVLAISKSDTGITPLPPPYARPLTRIAGSTCWLLERVLHVPSGPKTRAYRNRPD